MIDGTAQPSVLTVCGQGTCATQECITLLRGRRKRLLKEGNHEEHKKEPFFSFVAFVFFVVQGFYAFCDNLVLWVLLIRTWTVSLIQGKTVQTHESKTHCCASCRYLHCSCMTQMTYYLTLERDKICKPQLPAIPELKLLAMHQKLHLENKLLVHPHVLAIILSIKPYQYILFPLSHPVPFPKT